MSIFKLDEGNRVAIVSALRTPIGAFCGSLSGYSAHDLGKLIITASVQQLRLDPYLVSEVILGQVLTAGCGQNPARQASMNAHLPYITSAYSINQVCGSGLKSVILGCQGILLRSIENMAQEQNDDSHNIVIVGGQESMTNSMHGIHLRKSHKMGNQMLSDLMLLDGLTDAFSKDHMGLTAENIAEEYGVSRAEQDEYALRSEERALAAFRNGKFANEIVPIEVCGYEANKGYIKSSEFLELRTNSENNEENFLIGDECIRVDTDIAKLSKLKPAFKADGTVTAGNSSGLSDGASILVLMPEKLAEEMNISPLAYIKSWAQSGVMPDLMGTSPIMASTKALQLAGWESAQLNLIELNEAFAVQCIAVIREMGWDVEKVNVNGGAIALGHPIGSSGARILTTLVHALNERGGGKGLATLCIGGGMGLAMCVETK